MEPPVIQPEEARADGGIRLTDPAVEFARGTRMRFHHSQSRPALVCLPRNGIDGHRVLVWRPPIAYDGWEFFRGETRLPNPIETSARP